MSPIEQRLEQGYSAARIAQACGVGIGAVQYVRLMRVTPARHGLVLGKTYRWLGTDTKPFKRPTRVTLRGWVHYEDHLGGRGKATVAEFKRWAGL